MNITGEFDNVFNELRSASLTSNFNVIRSDWPNPFWDSQNLNPRVLPIALLANEGFAFQDTYRSYVNYYEKVENATGIVLNLLEEVEKMAQRASLLSSSIGSEIRYAWV